MFFQRLKAENICSEDKLPSVSSINRIVRSNKRYDNTSSSPLSSSSLTNYNQSYDNDNENENDNENDNEDASYDNTDEYAADADNYENDTQRPFYIPAKKSNRIKKEKIVNFQNCFFLIKNFFI